MTAKMASSEQDNFGASMTPLVGEETPEKPARRPLTMEEQRTAMWCHLSSLSGLVIPGFNILAPLFCWLSRKDSSRFVNFHGKESLNFQINMLLYSLFACPFCCAGLGVLAFTGMTLTGQSAAWAGMGVSFVFLGMLTIYEIIISVVAGIKASEGVWYRYPYVLYRFFK
jgi:uncharacterized Tic20 family protein